MNIKEYFEKLNAKSQEIFQQTIPEHEMLGRVHQVGFGVRSCLLPRRGCKGKRQDLTPAAAGGLEAGPEKRWYRSASKQFNGQINGYRAFDANPELAHGPGDSLPLGRQCATSIHV